MLGMPWKLIRLENILRRTPRREKPSRFHRFGILEVNILIGRAKLSRDNYLYCNNGVVQYFASISLLVRIILFFTSRYLSLSKSQRAIVIRRKGAFVIQLFRTTILT